MNWVKNIVGKKPSEEGGAEDHWEGAHDAAVIRKLYAEYCSLRNEGAKDAKLNEILPMFCRVYSNVNPHSIGSRFPEVHSFAYQTARRFVIHVRTLAGSTSREVAASSIIEFLDKKSGSIGWYMLCALDLLSETDDHALESMAKASLPSTLVKSIYLFIDHENDEVESPVEEEGHLRDKYEPKFCGLMIRVIQHFSAAEELLKTDDISLFFRIATMRASGRNKIWKKCTVEALSLFCRHCLTGPVCSYIHSQNCLTNLVNNLRKNKDNDAIEVADMLTTVVFIALKESGKSTRVLLEEFSHIGGYQIVSDVILKLFARKDEEDAKNIAAQMMTLSFELLFYGPVDLTPAVREVSKYLDENFRLPKPSGAGVSVRNPEALSLYMSLFYRTKSVTVRSQCIEAILNIISLDTVNYYLLEHHRFLCGFLEKIEMLRGDAKEKVFHLLEYVVCSLNFVPVEALATLVEQLRCKPSLSTSSLALKTIIKLLNMESKFGDLFRDNGLLDILIPVTKYYTDKLVKGGLEDASEAEQEYFELLSDSLVLMLDNNLKNMDTFQEQGGFPILYQLILVKKSRKTALRIFQHYILSDKTYSKNHMSALLDNFVAAGEDSLDMKCDILESVCRMSSRSDFAKEIFCAAGGFEAIFKVLNKWKAAFSFKYKSNLDLSQVGLENVSSDDFKQKNLSERLKVIVCVFCTICETITNCRSNEAYFTQKCDGYSQISNFFVESGLLETNNKEVAFELLFDLGTTSCAHFKSPYCMLDEVTGIVKLVSNYPKGSAGGSLHRKHGGGSSKNVVFSGRCGKKC